MGLIYYGIDIAPIILSLFRPPTNKAPSASRALNGGFKFIRRVYGTAHSRDATAVALVRNYRAGWLVACAKW